MYKDHSLIPAEAVRLAALGMLAEAPRSYEALAAEVRQFVSRIAGPSLDLLGPPLEVLRIEGLVAADDNAAGAGGEVLRLTPKGEDELVRLLGATLRGPLGEFNKLVIALKLRFLSFLPVAERAGQLDLLAEACERELVRLTDLRGRSGGLPMPFTAWLDHDIAQIEARLRWVRDLARELGLA
jgi:DNA-binding PadR family transcriptional regulator